jgi:hypothetical protein
MVAAGFQEIGLTLSNKGKWRIKMSKENEIEEIIYQKLCERFDNIYHLKLSLFAREAAEAIHAAGYRKTPEMELINEEDAWNIWQDNHRDYPRSRVHKIAQAQLAADEKKVRGE